MGSKSSSSDLLDVPQVSFATGLCKSKQLWACPLAPSSQATCVLLARLQDNFYLPSIPFLSSAGPRKSCYRLLGIPCGSSVDVRQSVTIRTVCSILCSFSFLTSIFFSDHFRMPIPPQFRDQHPLQCVNVAASVSLRRMTNCSPSPSAEYLALLISCVPVDALVSSR